MPNLKRLSGKEVPLVDKELYDDFLKFYGFLVDTFLAFPLEGSYPPNRIAFVENEAMKHKFVGQLKKLDYVEDKKLVWDFVRELIHAITNMMIMKTDETLVEWSWYFAMGDETYNTLPRDMVKAYEKKVKAVIKELDKLNEAFEDALLSTLEKVLDPKLHPYPQDYADAAMSELWDGWTYSDETGVNRFFHILKRDTIEGKPVVVNTK